MILTSCIQTSASSNVFVITNCFLAFSASNKASALLAISRRAALLAICCCFSIRKDLASGVSTTLAYDSSIITSIFYFII